MDMLYPMWFVNKSMSNKSVTFKNITIYTLGILLIGLAVTFLLRADLGVGAWDATSFNLNDMMTSLINQIFETDITITYGMTSFLVSIVLLICVIIYRGFQNKHKLVFASIFFMSLSIDFWNLLILNNFHPDGMTIRVILFIGAIILLPLALALLITSNLAASVYDEFTMVAGEILKIKKYAISKLLIEILGIILAFIFSTVTYFTQTSGMDYSINGNINIGTLILAFTIGPLIGAFLKLFNSNKK